MATALSTITTAIGAIGASSAHTTRRARRSQQRPQQPISFFLSLAAVRSHMAWLRRQMFALDQDIASLTHTYCEMGEASDWQDARLPTLDETIHFFTGRYRALDAQRAACVALYVRLLCA